MYSILLVNTGWHLWGSKFTKNIHRNTLMSQAHLPDTRTPQRPPPDKINVCSHITKIAHKKAKGTWEGAQGRHLHPNCPSSKSDIHRTCLSMDARRECYCHEGVYYTVSETMFVWVFGSQLININDLVHGSSALMMWFTGVYKSTKLWHMQKSYKFNLSSDIQHCFNT